MSKLDPELDKAIDRFAREMKHKALYAQKKHGFAPEAWRTGNWRHELIIQLYQHVAKGDPHDVGLYCVFANYLGWKLNYQHGELVQKVEKP